MIKLKYDLSEFVSKNIDNIVVQAIEGRLYKLDDKEGDADYAAEAYKYCKQVLEHTKSAYLSGEDICFDMSLPPLEGNNIDETFEATSIWPDFFHDMEEVHYLFQGKCIFMSKGQDITAKVLELGGIVDPHESADGYEDFVKKYLRTIVTAVFFK